MNRKLKIIVISAGVLFTPVLLSPLPVFRSPLSTVVEANDGSLLGARIADDGQWRFRESEIIPVKFEKSVLTFEDRWFYYHPGINPFSILKAFRSNLKAGEIVSGGSTITMQVARLARGIRPRTYREKIIEMLSGLKLELFRSKKKILQLYVSNAPFGGNTVGLEAAAWRYTGKSAGEMSWAEAAALAVLPNSPALVFPGRNQQKLKNRRNELLKRLFERKYIDSLTLVLSIDEPLPGEPRPLPSKAPHLTDHFYMTNRGELVKTTIDPLFQERATEILNSRQKDLAENFIFNSACIIIEVKTGNVLAYVGNSSIPDAAAHGGNVDIIRSDRSTGSILKPLLYAALQQSGDILPNTLIADIPTRFPGFSPRNFDQTYSGAVSAASALSQSLNIPAVKMLQKYNPDKFLNLLHKTGFTGFSKPADYYGLSLILGGGETSLWDLAGVYASLSRVLNNYLVDKKYYLEDYHSPVLTTTPAAKSVKTEDKDPPLSASAIWLTYQALLKVNRPETETGWQYFASSTDLAWKTGTSFGFRDAWAVGTTPEYVTGVWAGNASGEGRPGLTGVGAAAPLMFDLFNMLHPSGWFKTPYEDLTVIRTCSQSGFRAGPDCPETIETEACVNGLKSEACPYHKVIHLNKSATMQVNSGCASINDIINESWFILPPAMEYFYKKKHSNYKPLPPFAPGCNRDKTIPVMEFIYPSPGIKIFIPRDQTGEETKIIAEAAHRDPSKKIFWHIDANFLGTTRFIHQIEFLTQPGNHILSAVDEDGNIIKCRFEII